MITTILAGGVIKNKKGEIAVVSHKAGDIWTFPKGHVEPEEEIYATALREIREETGLSKLTYIRDLPVYTRTKIVADSRYPNEDLRELHFFLFTTEEETLEAHDPDNPEARWVTIPEVENILTHPKDKEFFSSIKDVI